MTKEQLENTPFKEIDITQWRVVAEDPEPYPRASTEYERRRAARQRVIDVMKEFGNTTSRVIVLNADQRWDYLTDMQAKLRNNQNTETWTLWEAKNS